MKRAHCSSHFYKFSFSTHSTPTLKTFKFISISLGLSAKDSATLFQTLFQSINDIELQNNTEHDCVCVLR